MNSIQKSKLEYLFAILDENHNQVLQPDDFTNVAEKISDQLGYDAQSKARLDLNLKSYRLFVQILTDMGKQDISINLDEWLHFFSHFHRTRPKFIQRYITRVANYIFSLFDHNDDQMISKEEYTNMFETYGLNRDFVQIGFDKLDENSDGFISNDELMKGFYEFFLSSNEDAPGNWIFGDWRGKEVNAA